MNAFASIDTDALRHSQAARVELTDWAGIVRQMDPVEIKLALYHAAEFEKATLENTYSAIAFVPMLKRQWDQGIANCNAIMRLFEPVTDGPHTYFEITEDPQ